MSVNSAIPWSTGNGSVSWNDITDKPASFTPSAHTHDDRYYTQHDVEQMISAVQAGLSYLDSSKQDNAITRTVTISVSDWNGGTTCTKAVVGVTLSNIVFCDSTNSSVQCTSQGNGTLTFSATSTPTADVSVKVVML